MVALPVRPAKLTFALSFTILCLLYISSAYAAETASYSYEDLFQSVTLDEIVVTATRRESNLQNVPGSVASVTGKSLQARGIDEFTQLSNVISGLGIDRPNSALSSSIYIRGIGTAGTSGAVQSVGVLVDGVYQVLSGTALTELMDIERVEILRGPQGTLFGKNTTAGVIRVITADPDTTQISGKIQAVTGNYDAAELRGLINIPLVENIAAVRLNAYGAKRDGYTENTFLNIDTRNEDREGYRAKILVEPMENLQFKIGAEQHKRKSDSDSALSEYGPGISGLPPVSLGKSAQEVDAYVEDDIRRYTANIEWDFGSHVLSTISAYEDIELFLLNDADGTIQSPARSSISNLINNKIQTHEVQLASNTDHSLSYLLGYYWQNQDLDSATILFNGATPNPLPIDPNDLTSQAVFGNVTYKFSDQWSSNLGLRYTEDERTGNNSQHMGEITFEELTYSAKVSFQPNTDLMLYVSHDKGFKSGGVNREDPGCSTTPGLCISAARATWKPETTLNYEVGVKSELLDNMLRLNSALFYQTFDDFQVSQILPGEANVLVTNAAEVETLGVETDFTAILSNHVTLHGSVTYAKTEYEKYENAGCEAPSCGGAMTQDLSGRTLDHAPEWSANLGGEYRSQFEFLPDSEIFFRSDLIYRSSQNLDVLLAPETKQNDYTLLNARIGLESLENGWKVALWGNNLGDVKYATSAGADSAGISRTQAPPLTFGLTADYSF